MPSVVNAHIFEELSREFETSPYAFVSNFDQFNMEQLSELRRSLEKVAKRSVVIKHSIAVKLFSALELGDVTPMLKDSVLITLTDGEPQDASKAIMAVAKKNEKFVPRGMVFEKKLCDEKFVKMLAETPSRHELLTQMVVRVKSPITGFVMQMSGLLRGLVVAVGEIKKKKEAAAAA